MGGDACCRPESDGLLILLLIIAAAIYYWRSKYWITGKAVAISGHTLRVGDRFVRLHALNALHIGYQSKPAQPWTDHNGVVHNGGEICRNALAQLIAGKTVKCRLRQSGGPYQRFYAQVFVDCEDVGAWMVSHGYALADKRFNRRYVGAQKKAKREKKGIWRGKFDDPVLWGRERVNDLILYPAYKRRFPDKPVPTLKTNVLKALKLTWDLRGLVDPTAALLKGEGDIVLDLLNEL